LDDLVEEDMENDDPFVDEANEMSNEQLEKLRRESLSQRVSSRGRSFFVGEANETKLDIIKFSVYSELYFHLLII